MGTIFYLLSFISADILITINILWLINITWKHDLKLNVILLFYSYLSVFNVDHRPQHPGIFGVEEVMNVSDIR